MQNESGTIRNIKDLFKELEDAGGRYCIWKSNEHLEAALAGKTDLDVLVDESSKIRLEKLLRYRGLVRLHSQSWARCRGVEDWVGYDQQKGRSYHLHIHYKLLFGKKHLKNYDLKLEPWLFEDMVVYKGVKIVRPEKELVVIILRTLLRYAEPLKIVERGIRHSRRCIIPSDVKREMDWLLERVEPSQLQQVMMDSRIKCCERVLSEYLVQYMAGEITGTSMYGMGRALKKILAKRKVCSGIGYVLRSSTRWVRYFLYARVAGRYGRSRKKVVSGRSTAVAVVGADGSGKTTLIRDLGKWLNWKIEVRRIYFGLPRDNHLYQVLRLNAGVMRRFNSFVDERRSGRIFERLVELSEAVMWYYVARVRYKRSKRIARMRDRGYVVIAERYPMREFWHMRMPMDGPRIYERKTGLVSALARAERRYYQKIERVDKIYALNADYEVLRARKDDCCPELLKAKAEAINAVVDQENIEAVDANRDYEIVLEDLKNRIWKNIADNNYQLRT